MTGEIPDIFYKEIVAASGIGILVIDTNGIVTFVNDTYARFLKREEHEVLGQHITTLLPNTRLLEVMRHQRPEFSALVLQDDEYLCGHRIPLYVEGKLYGVMAQMIFQSTDEINTITRQLKDIRSRMEHYQEVLQEAMLSRHATIVGHGPVLTKAVRTAMRAARGGSSVLITGETGVGKEVFAQAIHRSGVRAGKPFIKINCAAIPQDLLESELFGYEEGAFTGARRKGKPGKFELAHEGTVFLDEIGEMPPFMQAKLLRVLQEKEMERVGGIRPIRIDVRIIAATNRHLEEMIRNKTFRSDLYYRLNVIPLHVPALRERPEDIPDLIRFYLDQYRANHGYSPPELSPGVVAVLQKYHWPGNVRELFNLLERFANLYEGDEITVLDLPPHIHAAPRAQWQGTRDLKKMLAMVEKEMIEQALIEARGNKNLAASRLGIHRVTLYEKLKKGEQYGG